jgi:hypothetical protein
MIDDMPITERVRLLAAELAIANGLIRDLNVIHAAQLARIATLEARLAAFAQPAPAGLFNGDDH